MGVAGPALAKRVRLLPDVQAHRGQALVVVLLALGVVALPTTFVVVPWLTSLR